MKTKNTQIPKDLVPIAHSSKNVGMLGYSFVWVGLSVIISTFAVGGSGVESMTLGWIVLACLLANIILGLFITLVGDIGVEHGLTFPVYMRAPFGVVGTHLPSMIRAILGTFWFGIQTYFGALAINYIIMYFTGFDNWFVWYLVFAFFQVFNTALGLKSIEKFANIAAPSIIVISIYLFIKLEGIANDGGINIWNFVVGTDDATGFVWKTFVVVFFINMAVWSTGASDSQNLTRQVKAPQLEKNWFIRNKNTLIAHTVALPLTQTFMIVIGGVAMIAVGNWNPVEAIQSTSTGVVLVILLLLVIFAQWSTNSSGNLLPPAIIFVNVFPKLSYAGGVILAGIIGTIAQPWQLMEALTGFLTVMSTVYSAIVGITFADYYFLRKRRLNVPELYKKKGQFSYAKGWNFAGIIALVVGVVVTSFLSDYAFIVGIIVSGAIYYILAKYWWFKKYKQIEIEEGHPDKFLGITKGRDWVPNAAGDEINPYVGNVERNHKVFVNETLLGSEVGSLSKK